MHYYPHHVGDYQRDTAHLTIAEHGAYRLLMDAYYATEKPLPAELGTLCRMVRAHTKAEREAVAYVIEHFFHEADGFLHHRRIEAELIVYRDQKDRAMRAGKASAMKRLSVTKSQHPLNARSTPVGFPLEQNANGPPNGNATNQDPETRNHEPGTSLQGTVPPVPGVLNEVTKPQGGSSGTGTGNKPERPTLEIAQIWASELGIDAPIAELWWQTRDTSDWWKSSAGGGTIYVRGGGEKSDLQVFANREKQREAEKAARLGATRTPRHPAYSAATATAGLTGDQIGRF